MKIREFNSLEEIQKYYDKDTNTYIFKEDGKYIDLVVFDFDLRISASIYARDIHANNISAYNITAWDIDTWDIDARDIDAWDIKAWRINALDIKAENIKASMIRARNINYNYVCVSYYEIICNSIKGRKENAKHFSLSGTIIIFENGIKENEVVNKYLMAEKNRLEAEINSLRLENEELREKLKK